MKDEWGRATNASTKSLTNVACEVRVGALVHTGVGKRFMENTSPRKHLRVLDVLLRVKAMP